jgi:hypothetical protein
VNHDHSFWHDDGLYDGDSVKAVSIVAVDYNQNPFIDRDNVGIVGLFDIRQGIGKGRVSALRRVLSLGQH